MCAYIYIKCVTDHLTDLRTLNAAKKWMEILGYKYKNLKIFST